MNHEDGDIAIKVGKDGTHFGVTIPLARGTSLTSAIAQANEMAPLLDKGTCVQVSIWKNRDGVGAWNQFRIVHVPLHPSMKAVVDSIAKIVGVDAKAFPARIAPEVERLKKKTSLYDATQEAASV
jgi:hypothetical protein